MSLIFSDNYDKVSSEEFNKAIDELQQQIDTLEAASDVTDVVGTYSELQSYDTSKLTDKDIIKVLSDSTHNDAIAYYRWSTSTESFTYIGSEGPYATISYVDTTFAKPADIKDGVLTITQNSTTLGSFSANQSFNTTIDVPTPNNATLTITQDGTTLGSFGANASSDVTIGITSPSVMTGTDGTSAGTAGLVPAPAATDADKYLKSDGTWAAASTIVVDQTFDGTSANAQSGVAVAEAVATVDLSDYYDKDETDELLNAKQNKLSPNSPLTITERQISNLNGLTYASSDYVYSTAGTSVDISTTGITGNFTTSGYIDIPYAFGQTVCGGKKVGNVHYTTYTNIMFGKYMNNSFIPILVFPYLYNSTNYNIRLSINTSDDISSLTLNNTTVSSGTTTIVDGGSAFNEAALVYGSLAQIIQNSGNTYTITFSGSFKASSSQGIRVGSATISDATLCSRLSEITVARIVPTSEKGGSSGQQLCLSNLGLYNYSGTITASTFTTADALGTNLFDVGGISTETNLDLHVGSGLAVQGGNLVNTNPPIITTTSTDYGQLTPDSGTLYIITDTGAIYLGSTLIAQKNA